MIVFFPHNNIFFLVYLVGSMRHALAEPSFRAPPTGLEQDFLSTVDIYIHNWTTLPRTLNFQPHQLVHLSNRSSAGNASVLTGWLDMPGQSGERCLVDTLFTKSHHCDAPAWCVRKASGAKLASAKKHRRGNAK